MEKISIAMEEIKLEYRTDKREHHFHPTLTKLHRSPNPTLCGQARLREKITPPTVQTFNVVELLPRFFSVNKTAQSPHIIINNSHNGSCGSRSKTFEDT